MTAGAAGLGLGLGSRVFPFQAAQRVDYLHSFGLAFMAFFAMMNPLASAAVFLGLTEGVGRDTERAVARKSLIVTFIIVVVFAVAGKLIFELFGITLPALRLAGGALVAMVGYRMVQGTPSSVQHPSVSDRQSATQAQVADAAASRGAINHAQLDVAISPLATPLLAGPGTIATAMNLSAQADPLRLGLTLAAFALLCAITYAAFMNGHALLRWVGQSGMNALTRIMGLILAVIGAQMMIEGIKGAFNLG
ncbi:hypothetical protein C6570_00100 [Ottowia oryzae]|uniref:UPF0056 membrane protein n=1 Tax=Ottowia oryzae TaxID=2109914 RepID=A0A2S0MAK3_9BURK|nr:hypothetical protein C6570_00100 [Ottowia oryzae]